MRLLVWMIVVHKLDHNTSFSCLSIAYIVHPLDFVFTAIMNNSVNILPLKIDFVCPLIFCINKNFSLKHSWFCLINLRLSFRVDLLIIKPSGDSLDKNGILVNTHHKRISMPEFIPMHVPPPKNGGTCRS